MRLYHKLNTVALAIIVLVALAITQSAIFCMDNIVDALNEKFMRSKLSKLVHRIDHEYKVLYEKGLASSENYSRMAQQAAISEILHQREAYTSSIYIATISGELLVYSSRLATHADDLPHLDLLLEKQGEMLLLSHEGQNQQFIAETVPGWGWVVALAIDGKELYHWRNKFLMHSLLILAASILLGSLIFLLFSRRLVRPLLVLVDAANSIESKGWHNELVVSHGNDEVGELSRAFSRMVHSRMQAEDSLRESEERYRLLANNVHDVIWTTDRDFTFTYFSPSVEKVLGYTGAELIHLGLEEWVLPQYLGLFEEKAIQRKALWSQGSYGDTHVFELALMHKQGHVVWVEVTSSTLLDASGAPAGLVGVSRDATRRKQLELQKEGIDKMIRHDLKHPLVGVISLPELLLMSENLSEEDKELLRIIRNSGKKMLQLIDSSLALYKIESGEYELLLQCFSLAAELKSIVTEFQSLLDAARVDLEILYKSVPVGQEECLNITADLTLFPFMLSNLIKNAIEASPSGAKVTLSVSLDTDSELGELLVLQVHNLGVVPAAIRKNFFDKYVTYGKSQGTGLGTYSARLIAQAHKGDISMQTSEEAGATTITVRLPQKFDACD